MAGQGSQNNSQISNREIGLALLGSGLASSVVGLALLVDDIKDFGLFSTPEHPSPLHHWQYGLILFIVGLGLIGAGTIILYRELVEGGELFGGKEGEERP